MSSNVPEENIILTAFKDIPYAVLDEDISGTLRNEFFQELGEIKHYYKAYDRGIKFTTEGSGGDYVPSNIRYKKIRKIINDEARFMFSSPLDVIINKNANGSEEERNANTIINDFVNRVLYKNHFNSNIIKAAKDCFVSKRVCIVVNFDSETGIKINFLNATEFYYEIDGDNLTKLVAFFVDVESANASERRIRKKTYEMDNGYCWINEKLYDGAGNMLEELFPMQKSLLTSIPAWIVFNDGLSNDVRGESDVYHLLDSEAAYSRLANADIDAERKSMNPINYTIDASVESTSNLSTSPGSFWDIQSDDNGAEQKNASVGRLESSMSYSAALSSTLERIDNQMHSDMSVPNIDSEKLQGVITSGKTIQALYFPLQVRSDEKMLVWQSALESMVDMIYTGALQYPQSARFYTDETLPRIEIEVTIEANYALPTDEQEEKAIDIQEVTAQVMSRKSYMKKWRGLTDEEADDELRQIALEREILEDSMGNDMNYSDDTTTVEDINTDNNVSQDDYQKSQNDSGDLEDTLVD
jgi:hypothetical protein